MIMALFMKKLFGKLINFFRTDTPKVWKDIEYFNPNWKSRIKEMSKFINPGAVIIDLGCGEMWLKEFITKEERYIPVDYVARDENTIVCDFNKYEYPDAKADTAFVSGCLEYVKDVEWFIRNICLSHQYCILSYCLIEDISNINERVNKTWVNHLSESQINELFIKNGFKLVNKVHASNSLFVFKKNRFFVEEKV